MVYLQIKNWNDLYRISQLSFMWETKYFWSKSASKIRVVKNKKWADFWQEIIANSKNLFQNIGEQFRGKLVSINQNHT